MNPFASMPGVVLQPLSFQTVLLDLLMAFVLGTAVAWLYGRTHRGLSYSRNMVHSLVLLCMIVSMVMLVVGDSVARAFGLVGALAIIRFRTVVRDARDTTFIFLALTVGIAIGAHAYAVALVGTVMIGATAALLQFTNFATRHADTGMLRVHGSAALGHRLAEILDRFCRTQELVSAHNGGPFGECEYSYRIRMYHPRQQQDLIQAVNSVESTAVVTVALDEGAEEW